MGFGVIFIVLMIMFFVGFFLVIFLSISGANSKSEKLRRAQMQDPRIKTIEEAESFFNKKKENATTDKNDFIVCEYCLKKNPSKESICSSCGADLDR